MGLGLEMFFVLKFDLNFRSKLDQNKWTQNENI